MGRRLRGNPGGIKALLAIYRDHRRALEYTLLVNGLRLDDLGTKKLNWLDLWLLVIYSPATGPLGREMLGEKALWGVS